MTEVIVSDKKRFLLPENWNELSYEQLLLLSEDLFAISQVTEEFLRARTKTKIALRLSGYRPEDATDFLANEIATKILPLIDFLFTRNTLTEQKLPSIRLRGRFFALKTFYGPADNFMNLTYGEFDDAEYWLQELQNPLNEQREEALNTLLAILYRPGAEKPTTADRRMPYSAHDNAARAKWFSRAALPQKLVALLWYMGCRNALVADFADLFKGKGEGAGSWTMLAHSLAGPALGNIDEVGNRPVRQVFFELWRLHQQAENQEAQK